MWFFRRCLKTIFRQRLNAFLENISIDFFPKWRCEFFSNNGWSCEFFRQHLNNIFSSVIFQTMSQDIFWEHLNAFLDNISIDLFQDGIVSFSDNFWIKFFKCVFSGNVSFFLTMFQCIFQAIFQETFFQDGIMSFSDNT